MPFGIGTDAFLGRFRFPGGVPDHRVSVRSRPSSGCACPASAPHGRAAPICKPVKNIAMNPVIVRVAVADDHPVILLGVEHEFATHREIRVDGLARDSTELIQLLDRTGFDVLVCDYTMPGGEYGDGLVLLALIRQRYPHIRVVVLTMAENPAILQVLMTEVRCIVSKSDLTTHLSLAVHAAFARGHYLSPVVETILRTLPPHQRRPHGRAPLTHRELEVVRLFVSGMTVNEIANQLSRSKKTISTQKSTAMRKLNIDRDVDLVRYGIETGLISSALRAGQTSPMDKPAGDF
nr:response regulator transcription factor [uncultured Ralstonia sp.]